MRKLTFILLVIIAFSCNSNSFKDFEENTKYINNLKGNIKKIQSETFDATEKFGEPVKGESAEPYFDLSESIYNLISPNSTFEFTENGKISFREFKTKYYSYSFRVTYDNKGIVSEEYFKTDDDETTTKYKKDGNKIISSITYDKEGDAIRKSDFQYENNLIKEVTTVDNDEKIVNKVKYNYDNGIQSQSIYDESGELIQSIKRDIHGRYLELVMFGDEKIQIKYLDKNPFPSEIRSFYDNEIDGKFEILLDDNNNISEIKEFDEDGEVDTMYKYVYKYDKIGNWIERILYEDDDIENITTRTIEYY